MAKTAMTQMLDALTEHEWDIPLTLIVKAKKLLRVEHDQIAEAYKAQHDLGHVYGLDAEQYYTETYGPLGVKN